MRNDLGDRLKRVRADLTQPEMGKVMGVAHRTYASYERGERIPDADALAPLVLKGWNANWLLTGEGPERLDALQDGPLGVSEAAAAYQSQAVRQADIKLAVQLLREAEDASGQPLNWTPEQQAEATAILVRLLEIGTASAEVLSIAKQQIRLVSGGQQQHAGSRTKGFGI